jgi:hypothetical protein
MVIASVSLRLQTDSFLVHLLSIYFTPLRGTGSPHLPSAVTSTVDVPLGSPSLCFPQLRSAVNGTVDHPLGSPSLLLQ